MIKNRQNYVKWNGIELLETVGVKNVVNISFSRHECCPSKRININKEAKKKLTLYLMSIEITKLW